MTDKQLTMDPSLNVLGEKLKPCSTYLRHKNFNPVLDRIP